MANLQIIKELIRKNNYTIRQFAAELGITEQGLQKLIRENSTKVDTLELIAKKLNVSILAFFEDNAPLEQFSDDLPASQQRTIEMQAETINRQSKIIENLTSK